MYSKILEIVNDVENELDVFNEKFSNHNNLTINRFIDRLEYNLKEIKRICEEKKKEENKMLDDLAKEYEKDVAQQSV